MDKEFIPYEQALALKELGFESPYPIGGYQGGKIFYYEKGKLYYDGQPMYSSSYHDGQLLAPLYQQAFRWFREKYKMDSLIIRSFSMKYSYHHYIVIDKFHNDELQSASIPNRTYEEAELECLKKLIEIVNGL